MSYAPLSDKIGDVDDPFQITKGKIQNAVQEFTVEFERWNDMLETTNTAASQEFSNLTDELRQTYKDIKKALKEMEKSIEYVQKTPNMGVSTAETSKRTAFVEEMKRTIEDCRLKIASDRTKQIVEKHKREMEQRNTESAMERAGRVINQTIIDSQSTQMQTQRAEQEEILGDMLQTLRVLGVQGHAITTEIEEQNVLLDEIGSEMDTTQDRIARLTQKLDALMGHSESKKICVIIILVIVLVVMIYFMF